MLFAIAAATSVVTLAAVLLVREVPLRTTVSIQPAAQQSTRQQQARQPEEPQPVAQTVPGFDVDALDDPAERLSLAALDVLTVAQDQARQHAATAGARTEIVAVLDSVGQQLDELLAQAHDRLEAIKTRVQATDAAPSLRHDDDGADRLRSYEYDLLLDSQRTAEKVTRLARLEAERILTEADEELAVRQLRVEMLKATEAELTERVGEKILRG
jgi:hypothetical protein